MNAYQKIRAAMRQAERDVFAVIRDANRRGEHLGLMSFLTLRSMRAVDRLEAQGRVRYDKRRGYRVVKKETR